MFRTDEFDLAEFSAAIVDGVQAWFAAVVNDPENILLSL